MDGLSRAQKKQSSEFTEFSTKTWKISKWVMPSAFIRIEKLFHKKKSRKYWVSVKLQGFLSPPYYVFDNFSVLSIYSEVLGLFDWLLVSFIINQTHKKMIRMDIFFQNFWYSADNDRICHFSKPLFQLIPTSWQEVFCGKNC